MQNRIAHGPIASLLSIKMNDTGNNYPQSYPMVENMLVNTNSACFFLDTSKLPGAAKWEAK